MRVIFALIILGTLACCISASDVPLAAFRYDYFGHQYRIIFRDNSVIKVKKIDGNDWVILTEDTGCEVVIAFLQDPAPSLSLEGGVEREYIGRKWLFSRTGTKGGCLTRSIFINGEMHVDEKSGRMKGFPSVVITISGPDENSVEEVIKRGVISL